MTSRATPARQVARKTLEARTRQEGPFKRPIAARITSVDPRTETVTFITSTLQSQRSTVVHPYMGLQSWIRVMPESGSSGLATTRGDLEVSHLTSYFRENIAVSRTDATARGEDVYRGMEEGEFELMSSGRAVIHGSERGTLELRGGAVHAHLNNDLQEFRIRAPTHRLECLGYRYAGNVNNMRFGVVKRLPASSPPGSPRVERPVKVSHVGTEVYGKEHSIILTSRASPALLVDVRMGHVVDDNGTEPTQGETSSKLRYRALFGTETASDVVRVELDVKGNARIQLPRSATEGLFLDVQGGKIKLQSDGDLQLTTRNQFKASSSGDMQIRTQTDGEIRAGVTLTLKGTQVVVSSNSISLGGVAATWHSARAEYVMSFLEGLITLMTVSGPLTLPSGIPNPAFVTALNALRPSIPLMLSPGVSVL